MPLRGLIDVDQLNSTPRDEAARSAFAALHAIQNEPSNVQVFAASLLFSVWCHKLQLDPADMHTKAMRMMSEALNPFHDKANAQLAALADFAGFKLADKSQTPTSRS